MPAFIPVGERPFPSVEHLDQTNDGSLVTTPRALETPAVSAAREVTAPPVPKTVASTNFEPVSSPKLDGPTKPSTDTKDGGTWLTALDKFPTS